MTNVQDAAASISNLGVSQTDLLLLSGPTARDKIKTRQGPGGKQLDYVTARYVMDLLDETVGPWNWQSEHTMQGDKVACRIGIRVNGEWIWKSDGAGETDIEGEKGSFSDALKRAAVSWGIARDLYPDAANHQGTSPQAGRAAPSRPAAPRSTSDTPAYDEDGYSDGGPIVCPFHGFELKDRGYGLSCSGKVDKGGPMNKRGYCDWKPGR